MHPNVALSTALRWTWFPCSLSAAPRPDTLMYVVPRLSAAVSSGYAWPTPATPMGTYLARAVRPAEGLAKPTRGDIPRRMDPPFPAGTVTLTPRRPLLSLDPHSGIPKELAYENSPWMPIDTLAKIIEAEKVRRIDLQMALESAVSRQLRMVEEMNAVCSQASYTHEALADLTVRYADLHAYTRWLRNNLKQLLWQQVGLALFYAGLSYVMFTIAS